MSEKRRCVLEAFAQREHSRARGALGRVAQRKHSLIAIKKRQRSIHQRSRKRRNLLTRNHARSGRGVDAVVRIVAVAQTRLCVTHRIALKNPTHTPRRYRARLRDLRASVIREFI